MAVFVDDMYKHAIGRFRGMRMSHMIADSEAELHAMARAIGMKREWYQGDHYDVPMDARERAITLGAIPVSYRQCGMMHRRQKTEGHCGHPEDAATWYAGWRIARKAAQES